MREALPKHSLKSSIWACLFFGAPPKMVAFLFWFLLKPTKKGYPQKRHTHLLKTSETNTFCPMEVDDRRAFGRLPSSCDTASNAALLPFPESSHETQRGLEQSDIRFEEGSGNMGMSGNIDLRSKKPSGNPKKMKTTKPSWVPKNDRRRMKSPGVRWPRASGTSGAQLHAPAGGHCPSAERKLGFQPSGSLLAFGPLGLLA